MNQFEAMELVLSENNKFTMAFRERETLMVNLYFACHRSLSESLRNGGFWSITSTVDKKPRLRWSINNQANT